MARLAAAGLAALLALGASPACSPRGRHLPGAPAAEPGPGRAAPLPAAAIAGRVTDAATGRPLARAPVVARASGRGSLRTDSLGRFRFERLAPGPLTVSVYCPGRTLLGPHLLDTAVTVAAVAGAPFALELAGDAAALCAEPDSGARRVAVRGVHVAGPESSRFVPCADSGEAFRRLWGPPHLRSAWVGFADAARGAAGGGRRWPEGEAVRGGRRWYVEGGGVLEGPGTFGHGGVSPYRLRVDSVAVLRAGPPPAACHPVGP